MKCDTLELVLTTIMRKLNDKFARGLPPNEKIRKTLQFMDCCWTAEVRHQIKNK